MKQTPYRKDIASGKTYPKSTLLRFVLIDETIVFDEAQSLPGRGCYLYPDSKHLEEALKKKRFQRCFKKEPNEELIALLKERL